MDDFSCILRVLVPSQALVPGGIRHPDLRFSLTLEVMVLSFHSGELEGSLQSRTCQVKQQVKKERSPI